MTGGPRHARRLRARLSPTTATPSRSAIFRIVNEVPTLLMIGIVILVVVKPF